MICNLRVNQKSAQRLKIDSQLCHIIYDILRCLVKSTNERIKICQKICKFYMSKQTLF